MNYYQAKFAREAKPDPSNWVIYPTMVGGKPDWSNFRLVNTNG